MTAAPAGGQARRSFPALTQLFRKCEITICIPAYEAQPFIARTLRCAQGQTFDRLRILVSVDKSSDETASICRQFARDDRRIEVLEQRERLGWSGNVNSLLGRVETPLFFLYFHDDVILPQYCALLRRSLLQRPDGASVHCDVAVLGSIENLLPARAYDGPIAERLLALWAASRRGAPLRSMIRTSMIGSDYRLPAADSDSFVPGETLLMNLMAAGPALALSETLYLRWRRNDGLTDGWQHLPLELIVDGWKRHLAMAYSIIDDKIAEGDDRSALKYSLLVWILRKIAVKCREEGRPLPDPVELHPDAPSLDATHDLERFGAEIARNVRNIHRLVSAAAVELT